jgi:HEAT repeat protein
VGSECRQSRTFRLLSGATAPYAKPAGARVEIVFVGIRLYDRLKCALLLIGRTRRSAASRLMRLGSPDAIESLRSQTGDPVCQPVAVLLAKIRGRDQLLGTASQFAADLAALPACRACGRPTEQIPGRMHS